MTTTTRSDPCIHEKTRAALMHEVRSEMYKYEPWWLAGVTGVSLSTVYAIRSGRTKWPRWNTLLPLLRAMRMEITVRRIRNVGRGE